MSLGSCIIFKLKFHNYFLKQGTVAGPWLSSIMQPPELMTVPLAQPNGVQEQYEALVKKELEEDDGKENQGL